MNLDKMIGGISNQALRAALKALGRSRHCIGISVSMRNGRPHVGVHLDSTESNETDPSVAAMLGTIAGLAGINVTHINPFVVPTAVDPPPPAAVGAVLAPGAPLQ